MFHNFKKMSDGWCQVRANFPEQLRKEIRYFIIDFYKVKKKKSFCKENYSNYY